MNTTSVEIRLQLLLCEREGRPNAAVFLVVLTKDNIKLSLVKIQMTKLARLTGHTPGPATVTTEFPWPQALTAPHPPASTAAA